MSRFQQLAGPLLLVFAFACGTAWHISSAQEPKTAQKWEYKSVFLTFGDDNPLKPMGDEGWELVSSVYVPNPGKTVCYFKRPK